MRETARCIAWTLALGALALLVAMFGGSGLEHADGPRAWLLFAVYAPYYLLMDRAGLPDAWLAGAVFLAQFAYFLAAVALLRSLARGKARWRGPGAP